MRALRELEQRAIVAALSARSMLRSCLSPVAVFYRDQNGRAWRREFDRAVERCAPCRRPRPRARLALGLTYMTARRFGAIACPAPAPGARRSARLLLRRAKHPTLESSTRQLSVSTRRTK